MNRQEKPKTPRPEAVKTFEAAFICGWYDARPDEGESFAGLKLTRLLRKERVEYPGYRRGRAARGLTVVSTAALRLPRRAARAAATRPSGRRRSRAAALRPSAIAQTMSDWPRCMSPAVKTPGTLVIHRASRATLPRSVSVDAEVRRAARPSPGPTKPIASSTRSAGISNSLPATGSNSMRPSRLRRLDLHGVQRLHAAVGVAGEPLRGHRVEPLAAFFVRRRDAEDVRPLRPRVAVRPRPAAAAASARAGAPSARPAGAPCRGSRRRCRRRR